MFEKYTPRHMRRRTKKGVISLSRLTMLISPDLLPNGCERLVVEIDRESNYLRISPSNETSHGSLSCKRTKAGSGFINNGSFLRWVNQGVDYRGIYTPIKEDNGSMLIQLVEKK